MIPVDSKFDWEKFWLAFALTAMVMLVTGAVSEIAGMNFFVVLGVGVIGFCVIAGIAFSVMLGIAKFQEWAIKAGEKRAEKR